MKIEIMKGLAKTGGKHVEALMARNAEGLGDLFEATARTKIGNEPKVTFSFPVTMRICRNKGVFEISAEVSAKPPSLSAKPPSLNDKTTPSPVTGEAELFDDDGNPVAQGNDPGEGQGQEEPPGPDEEE